MDKKQVTDLRSELLDSRFGAKSISTIAESKRFPLHEMRDDVAFQIINDELYLDGNARQNLATFCQTWDDENVHKLMDLSINKNWIDKEEYPQSAAIDLRCVNMVADLWHAPAPKNGQAVGTNTIGSSEACMLGGMAMKWRWRKRMEAAGKPTDKPNLVCGPVQICWHKFGLAPLGCGWVIWRDEEALPQELVFNVDYLGGQIGTFAINFSRPAGQVIAQYYEFLRLGREGYTKVQNASYQVAAYLADEIAKLGPYEFICTGRPDEGIPAVCFKLKDGEDPGYTLYDLS
ncbi:pyridoxal-dependent decarboxylase, partial [Escherichia coli]|uniref:pyridoxal-dependent decarboxylase n=1 Tax=Escherichia coli TaxID=562 RepID=UPI00201DF29D